MPARADDDVDDAIDDWPVHGALDAVDGPGSAIALVLGARGDASRLAEVLLMHALDRIGRIPVATFTDR